MRKVLFRLLITVFLFLVVVLGVAFYNDKTPLNVLKTWFGVEQAVYIQTDISDSSEQAKKVDITEKIQEEIKAEGGAEVSGSSQLSEEDIKATRKLVDELIVK